MAPVPPSEMFNEGDKIDARVIHVSADERRLGLSIKQLTEEAERKKGKEFHSVGGDSSQTLGDLLKQKMEEENAAEAEDK